MIRVGVVGTGGMGGVHGNQYRKMPNVQLFCCDVDSSRREAYCERFDATPVSDYKQLLEKCDIIDICLPTDLHLPFGLEAIASGRAVFMEKPMAFDVQQCRTLIEAAQKADVPLMPGQVVRYFPEFKKGHQMISSGAVGQPAAARTRRGGKAPVGADRWFMNPERSGGVLLDLAIHDFDWLRWTLGEVKTVYSRSVLFSGISLSHETVGDYALTTLTFDSGAIAHVEATWMDPSGFRTTFEICGSQGMIEYDSRLAPALRTHTQSGSIQEGAISALDDPYYNELNDFVSAVQSGAQPPVKPYDGLMAVSIARAAMESARTGKPVQPER